MSSDKNKRIPGMIYHSNKHKKKIIANQSVWISNKELIRYLNITFNLISGTEFILNIEKFLKVVDIIHIIDIELLKILNLIYLPHYCLIYNNEKIDIDIPIYKYYNSEKFITIIILPSYTTNMYPFSEYKKSIPSLLKDLTLMEIPLYSVDITNDEIYIDVEEINKNEEWIYGCRCDIKDKKFDKYYNQSICRHFYTSQIIISNELSHKCDNINTKNCNIFEQLISELCLKCFKQLIFVIRCIYTRMSYSHNNIIQLVYDKSSYQFIERFKDIIAYCFAIWNIDDMV